MECLCSKTTTSTFYRYRWEKVPRTKQKVLIRYISFRERSMFVTYSFGCKLPIIELRYHCIPRRGVSFLYHPLHHDASKQHGHHLRIFIARVIVLTFHEEWKNNGFFFMHWINASVCLGQRIIFSCMTSSSSQMQHNKYLLSRERVCVLTKQDMRMLFVHPFFCNIK